MDPPSFYKGNNVYRIYLEEIALLWYDHIYRNKYRHSIYFLRLAHNGLD